MDKKIDNIVENAADHDDFEESLFVEDDELVSNKPTKRRGIYVIPNGLTTLALFAGFYAVIAAINGQFSEASMAIFIAMVLDGLDGRVARMTNSQSEFGAEYDSLADMVSFGVAPALIVYTWSLSSLPELGWIVSFIYVAGAALRLARFNTHVGSADKRYFQGLASPAAAGFLVGFVWLCHEHSISGASLSYLVIAMTIISGLLMVSNVKYRSFKDLDLKNKVPFFVVLIMVLIFVTIVYQPPLVLFSIFTLYTFSGIVGFIIRKFKKNPS